MDYMTLLWHQAWQWVKFLILKVICTLWFIKTWQYICDHNSGKTRLIFISERELTFSHVCYMLSPVRLSSVCLSSVTFVRPTQAVQIFGNISTALGTLAIHWHPLKISRRSFQGNPSTGGVKHKRVAKYSDCGPIDSYISETVQDRR